MRSGVNNIKILQDLDCAVVHDDDETEPLAEASPAADGDDIESLDFERLAMEEDSDDDRPLAEAAPAAHDGSLGFMGTDAEIVPPAPSLVRGRTEEIEQLKRENEALKKDKEELKEAIEHAGNSTPPPAEGGKPRTSKAAPETIACPTYRRALRFARAIDGVAPFLDLDDHALCFCAACVATRSDAPTYARGAATPCALCQRAGDGDDAVRWRERCGRACRTYALPTGWCRVGLKVYGQKRSDIRDKRHQHQESGHDRHLCR